MRAHLDPRVRVTELGVRRIREGLARMICHLRRAGNTPTLILGWDLAAGIMLARKFGCFSAPTIFREGGFPRTSVKPRWHWLFRHVLGTADAVIAQSRAAKAELVTLGVAKERIVVVPNPCPGGPSDSLPRPLSDGEIIILGAGRLAPQKGFDRLIRGFKLFHQRHQEARLVILGDGPDRRKLEELVVGLGLTAVVQLPGFVGEVDGWYRRAHVFVLSSVWEGQSNSLLEAIIRSCRVIVAEGIGGTGELMIDAGLEQYVVPMANFETGLANALDRALAERDELWVRAARQVAELTSLDVVLARYWNICQSVRHG